MARVAEQSEDLDIGPRSAALIAARCGRCRFWPRDPYAEINDLDDSGDAGGDRSDCRRRAPITGNAEGTPSWPRTNSRDWCGEFEQRGLVPEDRE